MAVRGPTSPRRSTSTSWPRPLTNTLPLRRSAWTPGQRRDFTMAYIRLPELVVVPVAQRYTALEQGHFRYELGAGRLVRGGPSDAPGYHRVDDGFTAELEVDADGFVLHYPPYWRRRPAAWIRRPAPARPLPPHRPGRER